MMDRIGREVRIGETAQAVSSERQAGKRLRPDLQSRKEEPGFTGTEQ